jgi:hypothetical protein
MNWSLFTLIFLCPRNGELYRVMAISGTRQKDKAFDIIGSYLGQI